MDARRFAKGLAALFAGALAVRGVVLFELSRTPYFDLLVGDGRAYDAWARRIAAGDWLGGETFYQAPLYPYFLGALYGAFGRSLLAVKLVQAVAGAAACVLLATAGRRLVSARVGLTAGAILAVYPPAIFFDGMIQKSALDLLFVTGLLALLARLEAAADGPSALAVGGVAAAFTLTRENALVFVPLIGLWLVGRYGRQGWRPAGLLLAGTAVVLLPVGFRNLAVGGEFVLTTAQSGTNFYFGNHEGATGKHEPLRPGREMPEFERQDATDLAQSATGRRLTPKEVSDYWRGLAVAWIRDHPVDWIRLMVRKLLLVVHHAEIPDTESLETAQDGSRLLRGLGLPLGFGVLFPLAAAGAVATWDRRRSLSIVVAIASTYALTVALFHVSARYRYPLVPIVALFAAAGAWGAAEAVGRRDRRTLIRLAGGGALGAAATFAPVLASIDPRPLTYANYAIAMSQDGRLDEAVATFRRSIAMAPGEPETHYNLAAALARLGRTAEAKGEYETVLRLAPDHAAAAGNLGILLAEGGDLDGAERLFRAGLALEPRSALARVNLGNVALIRGDPAGAARWYREALDVEPGNEAARLALQQLGR